ncbi:MAG TPA: SsrA-binding protein SmpB [Polyangiaceae bacterium]|nr:SsrA-binding protein SmpB [Polyangiaceae bacterium]
MARAPEKSKSADRLIATNRRAHFNYELTDSYEAGVALIGSEARSLRERAADLTDAWVDIDSNFQAWVKGLRIPPMQHAAFGHEERRARRLLLHAEQIARLKAAVERDGMTIVVTKCYFKQGRVKLEIRLAKGRKTHDKRHAIKDREADREARQAMRRRG